MAGPGVADAAIQQYPWLRGLLGIPEVSNLILEAVTPDGLQFDPAAFQARLFDTTWWKTTPKPHRDEIIQGVTDPATQYLELQQTGAGLTEHLIGMGVAMDEATRTFFTAAMEQRGEDVNSPGSQAIIRDWMRKNPTAMAPGGRWDATTKGVYAMARQDYFLPVEWWWATGWATGLLTGEVDEAALRQHLLDQSANAFPHLGDWIMQGMTPAEIINPMRQVAADELEIGIEQIDIGRPEWKFLTGVPNDNPNGTSGKPGGWRLPTYSEVQEQARRDSRWWTTQKGRQADAGMARTLLEAFGKVA